jgi:hypothetical protein
MPNYNKKTQIQKEPKLNSTVSRYRVKTQTTIKGPNTEKSQIELYPSPCRVKSPNSKAQH